MPEDFAQNSAIACFDGLGGREEAAACFGRRICGRTVFFAVAVFMRADFAPVPAFDKPIRDKSFWNAFTASRDDIDKLNALYRKQFSAPPEPQD